MKAALAILGFIIPAMGVATVDLDAEEKAFVGQCIDKLLNAKSERVRHAAEDALARIGVDVIDEFSAKTTDAAWKALEKLCARIGIEDSATRLDSLASSTKDAGRKTRLTDLASRLRSASPGSGIDAKLATRVNALLAPLRNSTSFSTSDPVVDQLVELGHDAVPVLLSHLKPGVRQGMVGSAIGAALVRLAEDADLPSLRESLLRGNPETAAALGKLVKNGLAGALTALHEAVGRGRFGWEIARALEGSPQPPATARVVADWLKSKSASVEHEVAAAADLLATLAVLDATEALVPWAVKAKDQQTVYHVGRAMTLLGESRGVPLLIRVVANEGFGERVQVVSHRPRAAKILNDVSGKLLDIANEEIHGKANEDQEKRLTEAAKEYRTWWESNKGRLKFDKSSRQWGTN